MALVDFRRHPVALRTAPVRSHKKRQTTVVAGVMSFSVALSRRVTRRVVSGGGGNRTCVSSVRKRGVSLFLR